MTDRVDDVARRSAAELHQHVVRTTDTEAALLAVTAGPGRRRPTGRLLAVAASVALLAVGVTVVVERAGDDGPGDARVTIDTERDLEAAPLTLRGPRDGRDSLGLPVTAEPAAELQDGQVVAVTGSGFVPGESVGIVMCSRAAGPVEEGGAGAGVQACDIGRFEQVNADGDGVASGTFEVRQALTTPYTGTVDCAGAPDACIVAMGALSDYDRSGGAEIALDPGLDPLDLPTLEVTPDDGLTHADVVRVVGTGWSPSTVVNLTICAADPGACWGLGEGQIRSDPDGVIDVEVELWRFLPTYEPGTYADCALSGCVVRAEAWDVGGEAAAVTRAAFAPGGEPPAGATVEVAPSTDLVPGGDIVISGQGFPTGGAVWIELCATRSASPIGPDGRRWPEWCSPLTEDWTTEPRHGPDVEPVEPTGLSVGDDGRFEAVATVPRLGEAEFCLDESCEQFDRQQVTCDDGAWICDVRTAFDLGEQRGQPVFLPPPHPVRYR